MGTALIAVMALMSVTIILLLRLTSSVSKLTILIDKYQHTQSNVAPVFTIDEIASEAAKVGSAQIWLGKLEDVDYSDEPSVMGLFKAGHKFMQVYSDAWRHAASKVDLHFAEMRRDEMVKANLDVLRGSASIEVARNRISAWSVIERDSAIRECFGPCKQTILKVYGVKDSEAS